MLEKLSNKLSSLYVKVTSKGLDDILSNFRKTLDQLETHMETTADRIRSNRQIIKSIREENSALADENNRAFKAANNLKTFLGEGV